MLYGFGMYSHLELLSEPTFVKPTPVLQYQCQDIWSWRQFTLGDFKMDLSVKHNTAPYFQAGGFTLPLSGKLDRFGEDVRVRGMLLKQSLLLKQINIHLGWLNATQVLHFPHTAFITLPALHVGAHFTDDEVCK
jgi:hypothetical protein